MWGRATDFIVGAIVHGNDLLDAVDLGRLLGYGLDVAAGNKAVDGTPQLLSRSYGAEGAMV